MLDIPLRNIPQQRIEMNIDGVDYAIQLRTAQGMTFADTYANGELLKAGVRCVSGQPIIPYNYLTKGGNFFWYCLNDDYPYFENFETTQFLIYLDDVIIATLELYPETAENDRLQ